MDFSETVIIIMQGQSLVVVNATPNIFLYPRSFNSGKDNAPFRLKEKKNTFFVKGKMAEAIS